MMRKKEPTPSYLPIHVYGRRDGLCAELQMHVGAFEISQPRLLIVDPCIVSTTFRGGSLSRIPTLERGRLT